MDDLKLHHVGCAVTSIEEGLRTYTAMGFQRRSEIVDIVAQNVRVCFIETAPSVYVELVQGKGDDSPVSNFLKRRQYYYHNCYSATDVEQTVKHLEANGFSKLSEFRSEAFNDSLCAFLLSPEMALVELCTQGKFTLI